MRQLGFIAIAILLLGPATVSAEPYLAVLEGQKCTTCHVSDSGGSMRNVYGNVYSRSLLPAKTLGADKEDPFIWTGEMLEHLKFGANVRGSWRDADIPNRSIDSELDIERASVYFAFEPVKDKLLLYIDEEYGQGTHFTREAWVRWRFNDKFYIRAGQLFLPFGWRLEDDSAYIRQIPGINFTTADDGYEIGYEDGPWSAQLAVSNGTAGGPEVDSGKQYSLSASYTKPDWRVGGSLNFNDSSFGDRELYSVYAGYRTGKFGWLAEVDFIVDMGFPEGRRSQLATLLEGNWRYRKGQNLKVTYEHLDPDDTIEEDQQNRYSVVWEVFPIQYLQFRAGIREYDGIPQSAANMMAFRRATFKTEPSTSDKFTCFSRLNSAHYLWRQSMRHCSVHL
jgi:hypothetical protein